MMKRFFVAAMAAAVMITSIPANTIFAAKATTKATDDFIDDGGYGNVDEGLAPKDESQAVDRVIDADGYAIAPAEDAYDIESAISPEVAAELNADIEYILNNDEISTDGLMKVLDKTDSSMDAKNPSKVLKSMLEKNAETCVRLADSSANAASDYVYVIDQSAAAFLIVDEKGNGIANVLVTISYKDMEGHEYTRSTYTSGGEIKGIAAFSNMEGTKYGLVDIQAQGYRSVTLLQEELTGGEMRTLSLAPNEDADEVYIRTADISGKDLLYEDAPLTLASEGTPDLKWTILVTRTGKGKLPKSIELYSETRGTTVATFDSYEAYDEDTRVFTLTRDWVNQNAGLLVEGDALSLKYGDVDCPLDLVSVENAVVAQPILTEADFPLNAEDVSGQLDDGFPSGKNVSFGMKILKIKVSAGILLDGGFFVMAATDFDCMKDNASKLFGRATDPKVADQTKGFINKLNKQFDGTMDKIQKGMCKLRSNNGKVFTDGQWSINGSFSLMFKGVYDKKDDLYKGTVKAAFSSNFTGGYTFYFYIPAAGLPAYGGFTASLNVSFATSVLVETPDLRNGPLSIDYMNTLNADIDAYPGFTAYAGLGIHGLMGVELSGGATFDIGMHIYSGTVEKKNPRSLASYSYNLKFDLNFAFFNVPMEFFNTASEPKYLYDSWGEKTKEKLTDGTMLEGAITSLDLGSVEEPVKKVSTRDGGATSEKVSTGDGGATSKKGNNKNKDKVKTNNGKGNKNKKNVLGSLDEYKMNTSASLTSSTINGDQKIEKLSSNSLSDNQIQLIQTDDYTALFRLAVIDGKSCIVYQIQNPKDGSFQKNIFQVNVPDDEDVFEFSVQPNKLEDDEYVNRVYIAAVCGDASLSDPTERCLSTSVAGITIDLANNEETQCATLSPNKDQGKVFYHNPKVAGSQDQCIVAYNISKGYLSSVEDEARMVSVSGKESSIGKGNVFTTGALVKGGIFWTISDESSEKELVLRAYCKSGTTTDEGPGRMSLDISEMEYDNLYSLISGWEYMRGVNYLLINGNVYYTEKTDIPGSDRYYTLSLKEAFYYGNAHAELNKSDCTYQMFLTGNGDMIKIVGVAADYDLDDQTLEMTRTGSKVIVLSLLQTEDNYGNKPVTVHGAILEELAGITIDRFTCAYNPVGCENLGLVMVYDVDAEDSISATDVYEWQQCSGEGMAVTDMSLESQIIYKNEHYLSAYVTYTNLGERKEGPVRFTITDESGVELKQYYHYGPSDGYVEVPEGQGYWNANLYPGDSDVIHVTFAANPDWKSNSEHKITIAVNYPAYKETVVEGFTLNLGSAQYSLEGSQCVINGDHFADLALTNSSYTAGAAPVVCVTGYYDDGSDCTQLKKFAAMNEEVCMTWDGTAGSACQTYNMKVNLEKIWRKNPELEGVRITLVDAAGEAVGSSEVYLENPYFE